MAARSRYLIVLCLLGLLTPPGCVKRTIRIDSEPQGALVYLNDKEVGRTPCQVEFTWYGSYDVILRKEPVRREDGTVVRHKPLHETRRARAPWYQWPVLGFVAEVLTPWTYHDRHYWAFILEPEDPPDHAALLERARQLRARTLQEGPLGLE